MSMSRLPAGAECNRAGTSHSSSGDSSMLLCCNEVETHSAFGQLPTSLFQHSMTSGSNAGMQQEIKAQNALAVKASCMAGT